MTEAMATSHPAPGWRGLPVRPSQHCAGPALLGDTAWTPRSRGELAAPPSTRVTAGVDGQELSQVNINPGRCHALPSSAAPSSTCIPAMRGLRARYHLLVGPAWRGHECVRGWGSRQRQEAPARLGTWPEGQTGPAQGRARGWGGVEGWRVMGTLGTCPFTPAAPQGHKHRGDRRCPSTWGSPPSSRLSPGRVFCLVPGNGCPPRQGRGCTLSHLSHVAGGDTCHRPPLGPRPIPDPACDVGPAPHGQGRERPDFGPSAGAEVGLNLGTPPLPPLPRAAPYPWTFVGSGGLAQQSGGSWAGGSARCPSRGPSGPSAQPMDTGGDSPWTQEETACAVGFRDGHLRLPPA